VLLLTWAMIWARRTQALTVFLMAAVAVGAAVGSTVYVDAAQQRIAVDDVAAASPSQRTVSVVENVRLKADPTDQIAQSQLASSRLRAFEQSVPRLVRLDGFTTVFSVRYTAFFGDRDWRPESDGVNGSLEYRQDFCDHVILVEGRCVSGPGEALVGVARAAQGFGLSKTLVSTPVERVIPRGSEAFYAPRGGPAQLVVVGVYKPRVADEDYWGSTGADLLAPTAEPVFTDRRTFAATDHEAESQTVMGYARPGTFALGRLGAIHTDVDKVFADTGNFRATSDIETLLGRIQRDNRTVGLVAGVAAVPLVALCWYVLFLAIAYTAQARRTELGMVKLRGVSSGDQWWIAAAESLAPVAAGAVAGYLGGHLAVWAYARAFFGSVVTVGLSWRPLPFAAVALAGAVLAGLVAMRRDLASTATELLRRVPALRRGWRGLVLSVLVCAVAGLSLVQLRSEPVGGAAAAESGLGRFAPALLIVGTGLLCAVLVDPIMGWLGNRAMRRGRLGLALAGLHIGRRRSGSRLLSLVMVAVGLLTFAAAAADFSARQQEREAGLVVGANEVVTVLGKTPSGVLQAVRSVDPTGKFAMAAVPIYTGSARKLLAVDAPRLPAVAFWPDANGALTAQAAAAALHPAVGKSVEIHGSGLAVFANYDPVGDKFPILLQATVTTLDTGEMVRYELRPPVARGGPYTTNVACSGGCRLVDLQVTRTPAGQPFPAPAPGEAFPRSASQDPEITFQSVRQTSPDAELVSAAAFAQWRSRSIGTLQIEPAEAGLHVSVVAFPDRAQAIVPLDSPESLPMLDAGESNLYSLQLADGQLVTGKVVGTPQRLPRLGAKAAFTDLEYLLRTGLPQQAGSSAEVWLGPAAPADVVQRLQHAGLTVRATERLADQLAAADKRPAAVGLRFLLVVAFFGLVLGGAGLVVAAGVERRVRAEELRALRVQGLGSGPALGAAVVGYVILVGVAVVFGFVTGVAVWDVTGGYLPIVETVGPGQPIALLPGVQAVLAAALGGCILIAVAAVIAVFLARSSNPMGGARTERTS
jgi:putative ABC transport system permease protein